jgi:Cu-Zn family superoxide dismutase
MRFISLAIATTFAASVFAWPHSRHHDFEPVKAVAYLSTENVTGTITFTQNSLHEGTNIYANISGLATGTKHGLHIHQYGDLTNGCTSFGAHYNPFNKTHGSPFSKVRHVGDFGNIEQDTQGNAILNYTLPSVQLGGPFSVIGRGVVLHAGEDDLGLGDSPLSNTTGNAGDRLACAVIGRLD